MVVRLVVGASEILTGGYAQGDYSAGLLLLELFMLVHNAQVPMVG